MDRKKSPLPTRLSEVEAHQLLARAAELDARFGETVTTEQLSAAALEAGISAEALERAAADLAAGRLGSPTWAVTMQKGVTTGLRVVAAAALTVWLLKDASRPLAQGIGLALAVFGAYVALGWLWRRLNRGLGAARSLRAHEPSERPSESMDDHVSLSVRLFASAEAQHGAA